MGILQAKSITEEHIMAKKPSVSKNFGSPTPVVKPKKGPAPSKPDPAPKQKTPKSK